MTLTEVIQFVKKAASYLRITWYLAPKPGGMVHTMRVLEYEAFVASSRMQDKDEVSMQLGPEEPPVVAIDSCSGR
jgi:hypothetical protein